MVQSDFPVRVPLVTEPMGVLKSLQTARRNVLEILPEIATRQPMVSGRTGKRWHMVMDPEALNTILRDKLADYPKSTVTKDLLRPAIGESLFIAEGQEWMWQRRTAAPSFSHRHVMALAPVMSAAAERTVRRLEAAAGKRAVNMFDEMVQTTFEVISDVTFSGDEGFDRDGVHHAIEAYIQSTAKISLGDMLGLPSWVPRLSRIRSGGALTDMQRVADEAIQRRRASGQPNAAPDLLDLLLAGADPESGRQMSTEELRDNLLTFIVAGHETTALSLSWALYLVAGDPRVQELARAEAQSVLGDRVAGAEDVPNLPYIRQIVDEALRMYPPAALVSRTARKADRLCGREVRPGDTVMIPIYALHRNNLLWDDPDAFRPERFADRKAIRRYAYLPFGDGPRICIGASFALTEAVIILATLLSRYRFDPVAGRDPKPVMILTLRPEGGVWLQPNVTKANQP
ncbi:cytochrome P450 [Donghicola sp.]|uniref:cytochrome P450 n=1 Tax=Donghicola sp. TaxID=1929294 RepID=UPI0025E36C82|nr:cytochrome P450 [Donghicola sp.]MCT4578951.1 cytochrome P450 [Donghicola sp.]